VTIAGGQGLLEQQPSQLTPTALLAASATPSPAFGQIGLVAPGELARDACIEVLLQIALAAGRLPSCLDLHASAPDQGERLDMALVSRRLAEPVSTRHKRAADTILCSRAPVLFVPQTSRRHMTSGRALIVWDGSLSAVATLTKTAWLLGHAREIMLVDAQTDGQRIDIAGAADLLRNLPGDRHVDVTALRLDTPAALIEAGAMTRADYLVLGGFGHWGALPDILYGDCDSAFLRTPLPLLLGH
jgi:hypothetical protein